MSVGHARRTTDNGYGNGRTTAIPLTDPTFPYDVPVMPSLAINGVDLVYEDVGHGERAVRARARLHRLPRRFPRAPAGVGAARRARSSTITAGTASRPTPAIRRATASTSSSTICARCSTRCGVRRCDLLGHSMGGMIALRFALAYPRARRLAGADGYRRARARPHAARTRWPPPAPSPAPTAWPPWPSCCAPAPPTIPAAPRPNGASSTSWAGPSGSGASAD